MSPKAPVQKGIIRVLWTPADLYSEREDATLTRMKDDKSCNQTPCYFIVLMGGKSSVHTNVDGRWTRNHYEKERKLMLMMNIQLLTTNGNKKRIIVLES